MQFVASLLVEMSHEGDRAADARCSFVASLLARMSYEGDRAADARRLCYVALCELNLKFASLQIL
jgi:hypothetical protein